MTEQSEYAPGPPGQRKVLLEHVDAVFDAMWPSTQDGPIWTAAHAILTTDDDAAQTALAASLPSGALIAELIKRDIIMLMGA